LVFAAAEKARKQASGWKVQISEPCPASGTVISGTNAEALNPEKAVEGRNKVQKPQEKPFEASCLITTTGNVLRYLLTLKSRWLRLLHRFAAIPPFLFSGYSPGASVIHHDSHWNLFWPALRFAALRTLGAFLGYELLGRAGQDRVWVLIVI